MIPELSVKLGVLVPILFTSGCALAELAEFAEVGAGETVARLLRPDVLPLIRPDKLRFLHDVILHRILELRFGQSALFAD